MLGGKSTHVVATTSPTDLVKIPMNPVARI